MLKITEMVGNENRIDLILEGRIVGDCIEYLEDFCLVRLGQQAREISLDFTGVRYVEPRGVDMLKRISGSRLNIVKCPIFIAELLNKGLWEV